MLLQESRFKSTGKQTSAVREHTWTNLFTCRIGCHGTHKRWLKWALDKVSFKSAFWHQETISSSYLSRIHASNIWWIPKTKTFYISHCIALPTLKKSQHRRQATFVLFVISCQQPHSNGCLSIRPFGNPRRAAFQSTLQVVGVPAQWHGISDEHHEQGQVTCQTVGSSETLQEQTLARSLSALSRPGCHAAGC